MKSLPIHTVATLLLTLCLGSCVKKELPVPAHNPGIVKTSTVDMSANYKWQLYYDLKTNTVTGKNLKTAWDLGFEATASGYRIILNTSKSMFAFNTGKSDLATVSKADTSGFSMNKRCENPGGNLDSTGIGDWRTTGKVYLIDRGYNELGASQGLEKVQFLSVNDSMYTVSFCKLSETTPTTIKIKKDSNYNFTFLSFDSGGRTPIAEPPKKEWTIAFTQYTHVFYDPYMPYLVTGCLLNRYKTTAYKDTAEPFAQIAYSTVKTNSLLPAINTIGYDWKTYTGTSYITDTKINYVIKDQEGNCYKMHFTDFYNSAGVKGNPKWEYQQL